MAANLAPGDKAPDFEVQSDDGGTVRLSDFQGQKLVVFFYPKADTPGCTKESIAFSKLKASFSRANTALLGVSADTVDAQGKFKKKHSLKVPLGADTNRKMLKDYDAWGEKSLYGRTFMGIIRSTVLIDDKGRVVRVWPKVRVDGHAEEVLAAARTL